MQPVIQSHFRQLLGMNRRFWSETLSDIVADLRGNDQIVDIVEYGIDVTVPIGARTDS